MITVHNLFRNAGLAKSGSLTARWSSSLTFGVAAPRGNAVEIKATGLSNAWRCGVDCGFNGDITVGATDGWPVVGGVEYRLEAWCYTPNVTYPSGITDVYLNVNGTKSRLGNSQRNCSQGWKQCLFMFTPGSDGRVGLRLAMNSNSALTADACSLLVTTPLLMLESEYEQMSGGGGILWAGGEGPDSILVA